MPMTALRQVVQAPQTVEERIGFVLWTYANQHFVPVLGQSNLGLGYDSCVAAVAVEPDGNYPTYGTNGQGLSVVFGSSRLFRGLDPTFNAFAHIGTNQYSNSSLEQHAEQSAIRTAEHSGMNFFVSGVKCHLYVDFVPCRTCTQWLQDHPANWYVHYWGNQASVAASRRRMRSEAFGAQYESRRG
jgi:hypothetical protein